MSNMLSKRLETIASFIPKGVRFADIGSDHAYVPCAICSHDDTASAIAGEVREGPFKSAQKTVRQHDLDDQIEVRLGDGLDVIDPSVTHVIIAGMGGSLIASILERGKEKLDYVEQLILQPNIGAHHVRKWLIKNGFILVDERLVEEKGHIYEVLIAHKQGEGSQEIQEKELLFGPFLLQEKSNLFKKKWQREYSHRQEIIKQIKQSKQPNQEQMDQFQRELAWINEELNNES
ncbi:MAG TPA: tRNA (adenine(22)-N(1))-methyltransferase TrmK [Bacillota bacterium]|nr:tRNA (adenine(22)-N(1))-methyltransferase TrmK [Bacillota bacterium]